MIRISSQLTQIPCTLNGEWMTNRWQGTVSCREPFVILLLAQQADDLWWAKSLPSKDDKLDLRFELYPTSTTDPHYQVFFSSGTGGFIQALTARLPTREHKPSLQAPETFDTGFVLPFALIDCSVRTTLSFCCFAKADVVVRRGYVWGLKPRFLKDIDQPWNEILWRGRNGWARFADEAGP